MNIDKVVEVLKAGGVVIFPTDTVWGIGVAADKRWAIKRFYEIKRREMGKPTAVLVADLKQAEQLGEFSEKTRQLAGRYWPGALTIVVPAKLGGTVGLRVPDFPLIQDLCRQLGTGIVAGSANFSGRPAPVKREELDGELVKLVDLVVGGECGGRLASTVVDTTVEPWRVVRQGPIKVKL